MTQARTPVSFIATHDPAAAQAFYEDVMGLQLIEVTAFALVFDDHGQSLRVQILPELTPASHTVHGWQVAEIASEIARLTAQGVTLARFDALPQDAHGVWTTPDGTQVAWFHDPSGNVLSLTQLSGD